LQERVGTLIIFELGVGLEDPGACLRPLLAVPVLVVVRGIGRDCIPLGIEVVGFVVDIFWALIVGTAICRTLGAMVTESIGTRVCVGEVAVRSIVFEMLNKCCVRVILDSKCDGISSFD
jgi:hypothetical protein